MADEERIVLIRRVCRRDQLTDGGLAVTFSINRHGKSQAGFAFASSGAVFAYVNVCPHRGTPLDWQPGEVFDESGLYLICATHGAMFEPESGRCFAGPCQGAHLQRIPVDVIGDHVVLQHDVLSDFTDR